jgi:predicted AAA+ superfamily ATPase
MQTLTPYPFPSATPLAGCGHTTYPVRHPTFRLFRNAMETDAIRLLARIADALERLAPPPAVPADLGAADAFVWHADPDRLEPVAEVNLVDLDLLKGIERQRGLLLDNTLRFAMGLPANNALLWGARGTGKSSLVKAVHATLNAERPGSLVLVEIHREDIPTLPRLLHILKGSGRRCLLFCDDLSFDGQDEAYKSLKAVLEGGIEGRPANVVFYATSNRRHLLSRDMIENERSTAINPHEAVEEKVSLSDRFGLWLGFHNVAQDTYFDMVEGYVARYALPIAAEDLHAQANEWAVTRGSRSGRVAWQFIQDLAGRLGKPLV